MENLKPETFSSRKAAAKKVKIDFSDIQVLNDKIIVNSQI